MQRFVKVGESTLHFVQAVMHDPQAARGVTDLLTRLSPQQVVLDRTGEEWDQWQRDGKYLSAIERPVYERLAFSHHAVPYAVPREVQRWCLHKNVPMGLMLKQFPSPSRRALRGLRKRLDLEAPGPGRPEHLVADITQDDVLDIKELKQWYQDRHARSAKALQRLYGDQHARVACVVAYPWLDAIADQVNRAAH